MFYKYFMFMEMNRILWYLSIQFGTFTIHWFQSSGYNYQESCYLKQLQHLEMSHKLLGYKISLSPFSPIWKNPSITCCMDDTWKLWYHKGIQEFCHLFDNGTFLSFAQLQQSYVLHPSHLFRFFQIRRALNIENVLFNNPHHQKLMV